jgi:hypothetical protein
MSLAKSLSGAFFTVNRVAAGTPRRRRATRKNSQQTKRTGHGGEIAGTYAGLSQHSRPVQTLVDYILDRGTLETVLRNFPTVKRDDAGRLLRHSK